ncbi:YHYH protein [Granulosicoccus sp.]|nr:YHYH protein [Granulosicoccus sp.]MDB4224053.1 YHYH protein [Granulosicoccus sp.]
MNIQRTASCQWGKTSIMLALSTAISISYPAVAADPIDITNGTFSGRSPNCAEYAANYISSAQDINNDVSFKGSMVISVEDGRCYFKSNAIPNHDFNDGTKGFRNDVSEQDQSNSVTAEPALAESSMALSLSYDNAIFLNGVKLDLLAAACYGEGKGPLGQEKIGCRDQADGVEHPWRYDPLSQYNDFGTDTHNAHAQPDGSYHYHGGPQVLFDADCVSNGVASAVIGFAADGFPIYGSCFNDNGTVRKAISSYVLKTGDRQDVDGFTTPDSTNVASAQYDGQFRGDFEYSEGQGDLDACNGMMTGGTYGYYVTESYPWVLGCFSGTPDDSFAKRRR